MMHPEILWTPSSETIQDSGLNKYMVWLQEHKDLHFSEYKELWEWSVDEIEDFWLSLWEYFDIIYSESFESILDSHKMPGARWFQGAQLNYAEHVFRMKNDDQPAIIHCSEQRETAQMSWRELEEKVASVAAFMKSKGVEKGDSVVAFSANIYEATIAFLAANSLGAIWSSCSPDFGVDSVLERFGQIEPVLLFAVNGYSYNGKIYDKSDVVTQIIDALPSLKEVVIIPFIDSDSELLEDKIMWAEIEQTNHTGLEFVRVDFNDPIWVLYSSGTTGNPKAITHSHGGMLLEHLKYMTFHNDVKQGENFYWFSTTGWMMWNFVNASLLVGATVVLYDGAAGYPSLNALWELAADIDLHHFGTSAPFIVACMKSDINPGKNYNLKKLRSIGSTGSPLPPEAFSYVSDNIKKDVWLCSMSGGTDVCTAFVGGNPLRKVYKGEIQSRALGCALYAYDEIGNAVIDEVGEMVITQPMPCMPIYFWGDEDMERYKEAYFSEYEGVWRHGDWIRITQRDSLIILGRSDATLNRQGVRIGTAEIYRTVNQLEEIQDSLIVNIEQEGGNHFMPLFVKLFDGQKLTSELVKKIKIELRSQYSPRHVPDAIISVPDIPYTISGKKMETPVKKILMNMPVDKSVNKDAMKNPDCVQFFIDYRDQL